MNIKLTKDAEEILTRAHRILADNMEFELSMESVLEKLLTDGSEVMIYRIALASGIFEENIFPRCRK